MRPLSQSERRLLAIVGILIFAVFSYWGYTQLTAVRTKAIAARRPINTQMIRLKALKTEEASAAVTRQWIDQRLPRYRSVDEFETALYKVVTAKASDLSISLDKCDTRPVVRDDLVHRSVVDFDFSDEIDKVVPFLHALQDREAFRAITRLELSATKDEERIRVQARIEQWWRPDSEEFFGVESEPAPAAASAPGAPSTPLPPGVEQNPPTAVKTASSATAPAPPEAPAK